MALSFLQNLFGGTSAQQQSTTTPVDMTPKPFKELQKPVASSLKGLIPTAGNFFGNIPTVASSGGAGSGLFTAATTETPEAQQLRDLLMQDTNGATGRQAYLGDVMSGQYLPGQPGGNPFYDQFYQAAARPFTTEYENTVGRVLPSRFTQAGHVVGPGETSSAFDRARGVATQGYASSLSDLAAKLGFETYQAERGNQQKAVELSQADTDLMIKNYEAQLLPTFIAQWGVDQGLKEYQSRVTAALEILKTAANVTQPTISQQQQSTQSSTSTGGIIPGIASLFSGGKSGGGGTA